MDEAAALSTVDLADLCFCLRRCCKVAGWNRVCPFSFAPMSVDDSGCIVAVEYLKGKG